MNGKPLLMVQLRTEQDVVLARQRARQLAGLLGFVPREQTGIATAISELARNAFRYAGGGRVQFQLGGDPARQLVIRVEDSGPGIPHLDQVLSGRYRSTTGMGLGLTGTRRLMDGFQIEAPPGDGTHVTVHKWLPDSAATITSKDVARITDELARTAQQDPLQEVQEQNQELLRALGDLRSWETELRQLNERLEITNRELEETNRGVVALYAELDEKAEYLEKASNLKSRFLSNMSHEFRTPVNSILSLTGLLLEGVDGDLNGEQEKQVSFIRKSAEALSELVNDLLDLAKVESGQVTVRAEQFEVRSLFAALRGMLRPMLPADCAVSLIFEEPVDVPELYTDEAKVAQILRNFISNALKFTERGEVRVSARPGPNGCVILSVADTGIGISPEDQERVFEEFTQVENPLQRHFKGTGLGLPLTRRLCELLGGSVLLHSEPGSGSTFSAIIPAHFADPDVGSSEITTARDPARLPLLAVEDSRETLLVYEKYLKGSGYQLIPARTLHEARAALREFRPAAILLDIQLKGEDTWEFLRDLKENPATSEIPTLVVTVVDNPARAQRLGADAFSLKPLDRDWLLSQLRTLTGTRSKERLLIIDDDEVSRYLLRGLLPDSRFEIVEATDGPEGLELARQLQPRVIFLDLIMPDTDGFEVLQTLKADRDLREIPVLIHTSKRLQSEDVERLSAAAAILSKESPSRQAAQQAVNEALARAGVAPQPVTQ